MAKHAKKGDMVKIEITALRKLDWCTFWCSVVTTETFSSDLRNYRKKEEKTPKIKKNYKI